MKEKEIKLYLLNKGLKPHLKGFKCLTCAIKLMMDNPGYYDGMITKTLYPNIADILGNDNTGSKVERAIRHLINTSGYYKTNSEFIELCIIELENNIK